MDLFLVALPAPERIPELIPMMPRETAWGVAEEDRYLWNGRIVGRLLEFRVPRWEIDRLPSRFRRDARGWRILEIAREAYDPREAARRGVAPLDLTPILLRILARQDDWIVWCVRDIDQRPVEYAGMAPEDVVARVGRLLVGDGSVSDLIAWRR
jgi:hypothetical protein